MIPMVYPWCHSTISNQKTSKRKVVLKADIRWRLRIRTFDEPERRCREAREVMKKWGSWSDARREARKKSIKKRFPERKLDGNPQRLKRRRATLPHPLECSTIAAPGLSYRVRNGTGRLTRAMTTAKPRSRNDSQNTWRPFRPLCYEPWRFGNRLADARQSLPLYRSVTIPTHIAVQDDPAQERRGTNPPQGDRNVVSPSPVSTGRLHPSRGFHLRPIKHVFNMRATTVQDRTES